MNHASGRMSVRAATDHSQVTDVEIGSKTGYKSQVLVFSDTAFTLSWNLRETQGHYEVGLLWATHFFTLLKNGFCSLALRRDKN